MLTALRTTIPYTATALNLGTTANDKYAVWENLLSYLKTEATFTGHYPFWESDLAAGSLFKGISNECDYDTDATHTIDIDKLVTDTAAAGTTVWNESLQDLFKTWVDFAKVKDENQEIVTGGLLTFGDIFKADAGLSFETAPFVKAWKNIDNQTYAAVRSSDMVKTVMTSERNLQFTRKTSSAARPFIRLIMPKYTRRVEIEDLNRDFWVIGQAITGISQYLFDNDSPMVKLFNGIFNEVIQLWENIVYLWAIYGLLTKKQYPIRFLYIPTPNNSYQPAVKYDNFDTSSITAAVLESRCSYLLDKYPNESLVIMPFLRAGNYRKNYYSKQIFPYLLIYNRYKKTWAARPLKCNDKTFTISLTGSECGQNWGKALYAIKETGDISYKYCAPCQEADYGITEEKGKYYGLLRVIPQVVSLNYDANSNIQIGGLSVAVYDAAAQTIEGKDKMINNFVVDTGISDKDTGDVIFSAKAKVADRDFIGIKTLSKAKGEAYYQGELVSGYAKEIVPLIENGDLKVVKIGDFYPAEMAKAGTGFERITAQSGSKTNRYCWDTYGIGSFYNTHSYNPDTQKGYYTEETKLLFRYYGTGDYFEGHTLTRKWLREKGKEYISKIVGDNDNYSAITDKPTLFVTRIGIGYWTGTSGSQWSHGVFCDLFFSSGSEVIPLGPIYLFDGYWTRNENIFTVQDYSQWRSLRMKCKSFTARTIAGNTTYIINGGRLAWIDYNKVVYNGTTGTNSDTYFNQRPNCNISLTTNDNGDTTLKYSGHTNPIVSSQTQFTPQITQKKDENAHIFISTADKLSTNGPTLSLVNGTYNSSTLSFLGGGDAAQFYIKTT